MKSYTVGDTGSSSKFDVVGSNRHFKRSDLVQVWSYSPYDKAGGQLDDSEIEIFSQKTQLAVGKDLLLVSYWTSFFTFMSLYICRLFLLIVDVNAIFLQCRIAPSQ